MNTQLLLYRIALTQINGVGINIARHLLDVFGNEENIFQTDKKQLSKILKGRASKLIDEILNPEILRKAENELNFIIKNKIKTYFITDDDYPIRMKECSDAPILIYFKGDCNFSTPKVIGIVGTRKATNYGCSFCDQFIEEIQSHYPDTLIVSGLAYGIDINAHRSALKHNLSTVGVMAHGLDRIYPATHRETAIEMLEHGGLITEFVSGTEPDKHNFVRRNRIIAGLSDTVIIVESDVKGGSLITADIAHSYNRDVFAVPGKITDSYSKGCNKLISENKAAIFESTEDFLKQMNWNNLSKEKATIMQPSLFLDLSNDEQAIYDVLQKSETTHINTISAETNIAISQLLFHLFEMEMKGIVKPLPGGQYILNK